MKEFFKMVGATMLGMLLFSVVMFLFCMIGLAGIMASEGTTKIDEGSILRITLSGEMTERSQETIMSLFSDEESGLALDEALEAIDKAAKSDNVLGIYLETGSLSATPAMMQELRQALVRFKDSKKWIVAYGDTYSQGGYYVASVADELYINPDGMLDWHGLAAQPVFYTDLMKKLGVKMQVFKVGTFKSAVEPYINTEMSEPNREQVTSYLSSIWNQMLKDVSASRKVTADQLNALADTMLTLQPAPYYVQQKMVDKTLYKDEVRSILKKKAGIDEKDQLTFVSPSTMAKAEVGLEKISDVIAVYYAFGDIVDSDSDLTGMTAESTIATEPTIKELDKLMDDDDVKAVVIRVNSGGGSAYASEQIWRQITRLKEKKPVVISMGGLAASGGYYISCNASSIVAEPTTLTGSIGIFGMIPDYSELMTDKLGLHYDVVKTNAHGDFGDPSRPFNESEGRMMQAYVERGYDLFTRRVAEGRKISQDSVKAIAEGRVWTGEQAKKLGLVDELGDLQVAIQKASKLAKTDKYSISTYPAPKSAFDSLFDKEDAPDFMEGQLKALLGEYYDVFCTIRNAKQQNRLQARMPYKLIIR